MGLYLLDYGAGNVRSLANSLTKLGYTFNWITSVEDFNNASKIIFPGVGAFDSAISHLTSKGFLEPLRSYIASGRPYFGICIGMQVLFASSTEAPSFKGLGIIDSVITKFDTNGKAVPHMGWNSADFIESDIRDSEGMDPHASYYFVHSYRAKYDETLSASDWAFTTTQYGQEVFISSVRKGNVFGTQFHPEKSGFAGLKILKTWLDKGSELLSPAPPSKRVPRPPKAHDLLTKRVIACLDVRANDQGDLVVTKGDQYDVREKNTTIKDTAAGIVRNLGKPVALTERYFQEGADEICLLNITSFRHSPLQDQPMLAVVRAAAETVFVPLTIGGGIKDTVDPDGTKRSALEVAGAYFRAGADKVSIGSDAVLAVESMLRGDDTSQCAIATIATVYGSQAVVVSIDPRRAYVDPAVYEGPYKDELIHGHSGDEIGKAWWYQCTVSGGREDRPLSAVQLARGVEKLGAGEILLNSIDRDGTGLGFDLDLIRLVRDAVSIPVVASSGAGKAEHFVQVFQETNVEAALAAGIFHRHDVEIVSVKNSMKEAHISVRRV